MLSYHLEMYWVVDRKSVDAECPMVMRPVVCRARLGRKVRLGKQESRKARADAKNSELVEAFCDHD